MIINPQHAIDNGWITGIKNPELQVQPNAIDFTLDQLFAVAHTDLCIISENKEEKQMRSSVPLIVSNTSDDGTEWWTLDAHHSYDALSDVYVDLPDGVSCKLIIRSTFNRNMIFLTAGLYDTGYKGHVGFALHNMSGLALIERGVRVGQIEFYASDNAKKYAGGWNHDQSTDWNENREG